MLNHCWYINFNLKIQKVYIDYSMWWTQDWCLPLVLLFQILNGDFNKFCITIMDFCSNPQLCSTSEGRTYLRDKNAYVILRELDKWEKDESVLKACRNVVHVLIADEPGSGMENLKDVDIPENVVFDDDGFLNKNWNVIFPTLWMLCGLHALLRDQSGVWKHRKYFLPC